MRRMLKKRSKRESLVRRGLQAFIGLTLGSLLATFIGKTIMEFGIAVLSGIAMVATGYAVGKLLTGVKRRVSR